MKDNSNIEKMELPLVIEYKWPGTKWKRLFLHVCTHEDPDDGSPYFAIEYREIYSHNAEVRFASENYATSRGYLLDAFKTHPKTYRMPATEGAATGTNGANKKN